MTTAPGTVLVLVDHPNLDLVLLPVIRELTRRGHRVRALVCDFGRVDRLQAAGVETVTEAAAFDAFLAAPDPRLFLNAADLIPQHALGARCDLLCRAHGVPSLTIQHASYSLGRDIPFPAHLSFAADCIALCGDEDARHYAELGLDPHRLVVTGAPAFDHLAAARAAGGGSAGTGVTIFGQGQTWVGPHSTLGFEPDAWCEELARLYHALSGRFPGAPLRIKPHPAEAAHGIAALYERAIPGDLAGLVQVLAGADDNARLILDSALVVSFSSSVWLEARFLGRAAVYFSLRPRGGRAGAELDALGGTWIPGRGLDLTARLEPHLDRLAQLACEPAPADEDVLRRYVGPPDGRAAARVADLAERLLADGPPDVDLPDLTFDDPRSRPRLLRPQVSYAHYVHLQALADDVTAAGVEHPKVLELAPEGSDLVAQLPLAFHTRRGGLLTDVQPAGGAATDAGPGDFDVVVAPDLWSERLPADPVAELAAMIALARRRVVFSVAAGAIDELHDTAAHLLASGALDDAPPACRPDIEVLDTWCRATGLRVQVRPVHNGASYCQSLLVENLGLEPESLHAVRRSLQAVGYPHERHDGGVRLVFVLEK